MYDHRKPTPFVVLFIFILATSAFSQTDKTSKNKAVVRGYLEEIANKRNWDLWDKYFPEKVVFNNSEVNEEGFKQILSSFLTILPDSRLTIEEQIAEGDKVFTRVMMHGTHRGEYRGMPASGKKVKFWGVAVDRIVDGKVVDMWHEIDTWGMMQQLGAFPATQKN